MANETSRPERGAERPLQDSSTGELIGRLFHQTSDLLKKELELVRLETKESIESVMATAIRMASAGMFGLVGLGCFAATLVLLLSKWLEPWAAALITGGFLSAIALVLVRSARAGQSRPYEKTKKTLKEDVEWAKERAA